VNARVVDVDLDNFHAIPRDCRRTVYWELDHDDPGVNPRFQKEEWFSSTLLEWGPCGKLALNGEGATEAEGIGFAQFAPATLFARCGTFPSGEHTSPDALYLAYVYVEDGHRGEGLGSALVRSVARESADRGFAALEAIGDRAWDGGWVLPVTFLAANGFRVLVDHERFPLLRLDIRDRLEPLAAETSATLALPDPDLPGVG
jgi:GNAT superfamily N-acetyltransferase